eukprot:3937189-Pleurochrysis_carterae.AAC.1
MSRSKLPNLTPSNGPPMITYLDFGRDLPDRSSVNGVSASGLVVIASSSRERVCGISLVGALAMVGVCNDGVAPPCWAFARASGDVGWALEASPAAVLVSSETAKSWLGSVCSP